MPIQVEKSTFLNYIRDNLECLEREISHHSILFHHFGTVDYAAYSAYKNCSKKICFPPITFASYLIFL